MFFIRFGALTLFVLLSFGLNAQTYSIKGTVKNEAGEVLPGATVAIHETQAYSVVDKEGKFHITDVKSGSYHLHIRMLGHEAQAMDVIVGNSDLQLDFSLKPSHLEIKEIVIEGNSKSTEEEQSLTIEIADKEFMRKNVDVNLMKSLEKIPGVDMISVGTAVSKPVIRGLGFNRVIVTQNGIKQEGQQWGNDHGLEIDVFQVNQVEIIKGPSSIIYGSDAIGGVLNISPPEVPERNTLKAQVNLVGHTNTDLLSGAAMVEGNSNGFFFRSVYSKKEYGDYKVPANEFEYDNFIFPIYNNRLKNTAGNEQAFSLTTGVNKSWGTTQITASNFQQQVGFFPGAHGRPNEYSIQDDGDSRNLDYPFQEIQHFKVVSNSNVKVKNNWLEVDLAYQNNSRNEKDPPHGSSPANSGDNALSLNLSTYSANFRFHNKLSERSKQLYGVSGNYKQNKQGGFDFLIPDFTSYNTGAFAFHEYKYSKKMNLNIGLRVDYGAIDVVKYVEPIYGNSDTILDYSIRAPQLFRNYSSLSGGAGFSWLPNHHYNIKLNVGSSFRYPTVPEISSNGVHHGTFRYEKGNADLKPERGYQLDFAFIYHKEEFLLKITPFINYFSNYIFLNPSGKFAPLGTGGGQLYQFDQAQALNTGGEVLVDYHLFDDLHIGGGGSYVWNYNLDEGYPLPFTPSGKVVFEAEYSFKSLGRIKNPYLRATTNLVAPQNWTARNERETPGYVLLHAAFGTKLKAGKFNDIEILFRVQNIFNVNYFNHLSFYRQLNLPEPGRNFMLSLGVPLFTIKKK